MAVGSFSATPGGPGATLAEAWNGTSWQILSTPKLSGTGPSSLASVSCTSASRCMAVGSFSATPGGPGATLAEAWNGTSWRLLATADPSGAAGRGLSSVSCTSASRCMAVGEHGTHTLAEAWDGTSWQLVKTPGLPDSSLSSVSCTRASRCMAVGGQGADFASGTLAEAWDGTSWRALRTPNPSPAEASVFSSVSCTHASSCMAVGGSTVRQGAGPLPSFAEAWNGSRWRVLTTANPRSGQRRLTGVSCAQASRCIAVGNSTGVESVKGTGAFAEAWNGTRWHLLKVPHPRPPAYDGLTGVWCTTGSACIATGGRYSNLNSQSRTLAEAWNGTSWRVLQTRNP